MRKLILNIWDTGQINFCPFWIVRRGCKCRFCRMFNYTLKSGNDLIKSFLLVMHEVSMWLSLTHPIGKTQTQTLESNPMYCLRAVTEGKKSWDESRERGVYRPAMAVRRYVWYSVRRVLIPAVQDPGLSHNDSLRKVMHVWAVEALTWYSSFSQKMLKSSFSVYLSIIIKH